MVEQLVKRIENVHGGIYGVCNSVTLKRLKGNPKILDLLYDAEVVNMNMINKTYYFRELPELNAEDEYNDIEEIANIYSILIDMGIFVGSCTFVKTRFDHVLMQAPKGIVLFTGKNKKIKAKNAYLNSESIKYSVPDWMNHEEVMELIWEPSELEEQG